MQYLKELLAKLKEDGYIKTESKTTVQNGFTVGFEVWMLTGKVFTMPWVTLIPRVLQEEEEKQRAKVEKVRKELKVQCRSLNLSSFICLNPMLNVSLKCWVW